MKEIFAIIVAILVSIFSLFSSGNLDYVKEHANETWERYGFKVIAYEGYQWGFFGHNSYGGAKVWYRLERPDNTITYTGSLQRWGDEIHIYGPIAIDAIKPK